jgi:hemolysin III
MIVRSIKRSAGAFQGITKEEIANAVTHGVGAVLSAVGMLVLTIRSLATGDVMHTVGVSVYGASLVALYTSSSLHHAFTSKRLKNVFLWLDHSFIYALVAGTYTPFMLTVMKGTTGTVMLCTVWALGILGMLSKTVARFRSNMVSIPFYLVMGWLIVLVMEPFSRSIDTTGLVLLVAGGLSYSLGVIFFLLKVAYAHAIWHVFVLAGSALHYACVLLYANPQG